MQGQPKITISGKRAFPMTLTFGSNLLWGMGQESANVKLATLN